MAPITRQKMSSDERGAALVELALTLPLLLVVIAGIVDFGFVFQRYEVVTNAAREGARIAVLPGGYSDTIIKNRVRDYVQKGLSLSATQLDANLPDTDITVTYADLDVDTGGGSTAAIPTATVTVWYHHQFVLLGSVMRLINASWAQSISLKGESQMRVEVPAS
jgi:Flp pilus assembly protein TadG